MLGGGGGGGNGLDVFGTMLNVLGGGQQGGFGPGGGFGGQGGFGPGGGFGGAGGIPNNFNGNTNDVDNGLAQYGRLRNANYRNGNYRRGQNNNNYQRYGK